MILTGITKKIPHNWLLGLLAHKVIEIDFPGYYSLPGDRQVELNHPRERADLVYLNGAIVKGGEIKPDSYLTDPSKNRAGKTQLNRNLEGLGLMFSLGSPAGPLTEYQPQSRLSIPGSDWTVVAWLGQLHPLYPPMLPGLQPILLPI